METGEQEIKSSFRRKLLLVYMSFISSSNLVLGIMYSNNFNR
jgi:hypothetical protein